MEELTERFTDLVRRPEDQLPLDRAALLIAAHARPGTDVDAAVAELDDLAERCPVPTFRGWREYLFDQLGFHGNVDDYYDPENSFLDAVVRRRVGLPITLSVVGLEIGRRLGLRLAGVGMPGHFLLQHLDAVPRTWIDPFAGGLVLDRAGCEERFRAVNGDTAPFRDSYLDTVGPREILSRMLANLRAIYGRRGQLTALEWVFRLRLALPGTPELERRDYARVLGATGRFRQAADELESLAEVAGEHAAALRSEATAMLARLN